MWKERRLAEMSHVHVEAARNIRTAAVRTHNPRCLGKIKDGAGFISSPSF